MTYHDTGKVLIGCAYQRPIEHDQDSLRIQGALLPRGQKIKKSSLISRLVSFARKGK